MIEEHAIVLDRHNSQATLEIERGTACGLCGQTRGCGNATWGKLLGHKSHAFQAENPINANVGDSVVVGINEQAMLHSVFLLYVVPLLCLLIGAILADVFLHNELMVILSAVAGLTIGFLWVKRHLGGRDGVGKGVAGQCRAVILRHADEHDSLINADNSLDIITTKFQTKRGK